MMMMQHKINRLALCRRVLPPLMHSNPLPSTPSTSSSPCLHSCSKRLPVPWSQLACNHG